MIKSTGPSNTVVYRKKKKKCDARRPYCSTCEIAGKQHECQYEENVQRNITEALIARNRALEDEVAAYKEVMNTSVGMAQSDHAPSLFTAGISEFLSTNSSRLSPLAPFIPSEVSIPMMNISPLDGISPASRPSQLLFVNEMQSAISDPSTALTAAEYASRSANVQELSQYRATFLCHHGQLGISFPAAKMQAIMNADMSGASAHPVLVFLAQLMGCRLWQEQQRIFLSGNVEDVQLQYVNQALSTVQDPITMLQVHTVLAIFFLIKRKMHEGRDQLLKATQVAVDYNMRFDKHPSETLEPFQAISDEAQEHICALSQLLYLDKAASIVLNDPSLLGAEYEQQFRYLQYMFPSIFKNNLVVLRAKSIALLHHTRRMSARWTEIVLNIGTPQYSSMPNAQTQWYDDYWELLEEISEHLATLNPAMLKTSFFRQREYALTLKMCMIISLTASAELHRLLANHHTESRHRCVDIVFEIVGITKGLTDEDYIFLDPILGTCWSMVATVLNQERVSLLDESQWRSSFCVIMNSAHKLGTTLPFMEDSVETISGVASLNPESPTSVDTPI
ncbi:uncharacterized protein FIBRA_01135 [Fibroporia radiculosa]|uniref:Zn(2)-C6 fungal-type domain-containing protein n=1 Tax=Fibroporia radiculosa TaxID=599839 RepID=J4I8B5_9APHY|nr:uncharacterized protein FIBRA_01135 [Fibroporia radiculosa]CCL99121.1 predicted protein [Fibroporia radiculosa]